MTKSQLIENISLRLPHLLQHDVEMAINITIDAMTHRHKVNALRFVDLVDSLLFNEPLG